MTFTKLVGAYYKKNVAQMMTEIRRSYLKCFERECYATAILKRNFRIHRKLKTDTQKEQPRALTLAMEAEHKSVIDLLENQSLQLVSYLINLVL